MDESGWRVVSGDPPLRILGDCPVESMMAHVRYWHLADIWKPPINVGFRG